MDGGPGYRPPHKVPNPRHPPAGGETAEMPGVYLPDMCDVAGTIVGSVERSAALPKSNFKVGDVLFNRAMEQQYILTNITYIF